MLPTIQANITSGITPYKLKAPSYMRLDTFIELGFFFVTSLEKEKDGRRGAHHCSVQAKYTLQGMRSLRGRNFLST